MPLIRRRSSLQPRKKKHRSGLHTSSRHDSSGVDDECDEANPKQKMTVAGEQHTIGNRTSRRRPLLGFGLSKEKSKRERGKSRGEREQGSTRELLCKQEPL